MWKLKLVQENPNFRVAWIKSSRHSQALAPRRYYRPFQEVRTSSEAFQMVMGGSTVEAALAEGKDASGAVLCRLQHLFTLTKGSAAFGQPSAEI